MTLANKVAEARKLAAKADEMLTEFDAAEARGENLTAYYTRSEAADIAFNEAARNLPWPQMEAAITLAEATEAHYAACEAAAKERRPLDSFESKATIDAQLAALNAYRAASRGMEEGK